jgi:hypothetical protein
MKKIIILCLVCVIGLVFVGGCLEDMDLSIVKPIDDGLKTVLNSGDLKNDVVVVEEENVKESFLARHIDNCIDNALPILITTGIFLLAAWIVIRVLIKLIKKILRSKGFLRMIGRIGLFFLVLFNGFLIWIYFPYSSGRVESLDFKTQFSFIVVNHIFFMFVWFLLITAFLINFKAMICGFSYSKIKETIKTIGVYTRLWVLIVFASLMCNLLVNEFFNKSISEIVSNFVGVLHFIGSIAFVCFFLVSVFSSEERNIKFRS